MSMPVMQIRVVPMLVPQWHVGVRVRMRLAGRITNRMRMLMVFVVAVSVIVR